MAQWCQETPQDQTLPSASWILPQGVLLLYPDQFPEVRNQEANPIVRWYNDPPVLICYWSAGLCCIWNHVSLCQLCSMYCVLKCMYELLLNTLLFGLADLLTMSWRHSLKKSTNLVWPTTKKLSVCLPVILTEHNCFCFVPRSCQRGFSPACLGVLNFAYWSNSHSRFNAGRPCLIYLDHGVQSSSGVVE